MRGTKNPEMPNVATLKTLKRSSSGRSESSRAGGVSGAYDDTRSQNSRRRSTRRSGGLPARIAEFTAPIEMPTNQLGVMPASASPS